MSPNKKRMSFFERTPIAAAIASKLVEDKRMAQLTVQNGVAAPSQHSLSVLSNNTSQSIRDAENIFSTQPDTEIAMAVLVSSIVSPNDLREPNLTWSVENEDIPSSLGSALLEEIRSYFEDDYRIKDMLVPLLEDCLFKTGSYPLAIVPESAIDDLINDNAPSQSGLESYIKANMDENKVHMGGSYLGPNNAENKVDKKQTALESMLTPVNKQSHISTKVPMLDGIYVTDSIDALKVPNLVNRYTEVRIANSQARTRSMESFARKTGLDVKNITQNLKVQRNYSTKRHQRLNPMSKTSRASIGHPLTINFPSSSIIPVHLPSDPGNPLGFLGLLDINGHPLRDDAHDEAYQTLSTMNNGADTSSNMLERNAKLQQGIRTGSGAGTSRITEQLVAAFTTEFERDIMERFSNGIYGQEVKFPRATEFYRLMLARSFANQHTQVLFIPSELMTYFAFDYNKMGIGQSLLDKMKILANIRSVLLFGNVMGSLKNSVPRREVTINLEESDPEPGKTIETLMTEYARVQSGGLPLESSNPRDIISGIRKAATGFRVQGNSAFPEVGIEVEDTNSSRVGVDTDLLDGITKQFFQGFCLTPDLVDSTSDIEFAQVALNSHLLFTKRVSLFQSVLSPLIKDHVVKYTMNDGELLMRLVNIVRNHIIEEEKKAAEEKAGLAEMSPEEVPASTTDVEPIEEGAGYSVAEPETYLDVRGTTVDAAKEEGLAQGEPVVGDQHLRLIEEFIESIQITLPAPDSTKLTNQIEQFEQYATALDAILPVYLSEDVLASVVGDETEENIPAILEVVKGYFLRDFISRNNIMPELNKLITNMGTDEKPFDLLEEHTMHVDGIAQTLSHLINKLKTKNEGSEEEEDDYSAGGGTDDSGSDDFSGGGDADVGGDDSDDFDFDFEAPLDESGGDDAGDGADADAKSDDAKEPEAAVEEEPEPEGEPKEEKPEEPEEPKV